MADAAIRAIGLGKQYRIGRLERYRALRDTLSAALAAPFRRARVSPSVDGADRIWSLKDVSFEIAHGEAVGIIGRNGAGKSTLLKLLSRITEPTEGRAIIRGRVGSLLEVGTGFHPELTGRENIFLNGAILGLTRADIRRKFDEIVAFAEVERFLDTPVKHYSSGMHVRLAFAVAAHLEPEVLLVDEVLAVGDAAFQKKCLGKMGDVAREGRTVLFVSHNMPAIENLCQRVMVLDGGRLVVEGEPLEGIAHYLGAHASPSACLDLAAVPRLDPRLVPTFTALEIVDGRGVPTSSIGCGEPVEFRLAYVAEHAIQNPSFGIVVSDRMGIPLCHLQTRAQLGLVERAPARGTFVCRLDAIPLVPGEYLLTLGCLTNERQLDLLERVASISVQPRDYFGTGYLPPHANGSLLVNASWKLVHDPIEQPARA